MNKARKKARRTARARRDAVIRRTARARGAQLAAMLMGRAPCTVVFDEAEVPITEQLERARAQARELSSMADARAKELTESKAENGRFRASLNIARRQIEALTRAIDNLNIAVRPPEAA